ncbi:MAG: hypothetical protein ACP5MG_04950 [Verrucomicrobiia bacterium]
MDSMPRAWWTASRKRSVKAVRNPMVGNSLGRFVLNGIMVINK